MDENGDSGVSVQYSYAILVFKNLFVRVPSIRLYSVLLVLIFFFGLSDKILSTKIFTSVIY